jgi:hypothetical protein
MAKNNTQAPEKDIVSFNQALELCSLGFDEPTFCMYEIENKQLCLCYLDEEGLYIPDKDFHAPTKGQVFRWFREKKILGEIRPIDDWNNWGFLISERDFQSPFFISYSTDMDFKEYPTYEEAENACIDKLIEIAKQQEK